MRIFDNYGRSNGKTMELAQQIAETIKGKGTVVVIPFEELIEYKNNSIREFAEWLENKDYLWRVEHRYGEQCTSFITAETIFAEYEKECKDG